MELHGEGSAHAACAAGLFKSIMFWFYFTFTNIHIYNVTHSSPIKQTKGVSQKKMKWLNFVKISGFECLNNQIDEKQVKSIFT